MAAPNLTALITDLRGIIGTTLPEVLPANGGGGIWEAEHADKVSWTEFVLPYAVILITGAELWEGRPLTQLVYEVTPLLIYVHTTPGDSAPLRDPLRLLTDALWPAQTVASAQRLEMGAPDWSDELRPNMIFSAADHPARAGLLPVKFLIKNS